MFEFSSGAFDFSSVTYLQECDMSKSKFQKHQQPLTTLQSMINGVLIQTGKVLREANLKGPKTIGHTHAGLQAFLPATTESFHLALDELEIDIVRAKAVLGRDLRELQSRRNQLENPSLQQIEFSGSLADRGESQDVSTPNGMGVIIPGKGVEVSEAVKDEDSTPVNLGAMIKTSPKSEIRPISGSPSENTQVQVDIQSQDFTDLPFEDRVEELHTDSVDLSSLQDHANTDTNHGLDLTISDVVPLATSDAPLTAVLQSSTFDSSYDSNNIGEPDINFDDLDFSGDAPIHENNEYGSNGGDFDLANFGTLTNNDGGDPSSILQDLDTFGDTSRADFNSLDLSNDAPGNLGTGDDYGMGTGDMDVDVNDSIFFNDMIEGMNFSEGDNDDGTGGTTMEHGDVDDMFFGINSDG